MKSVILFLALASASAFAGELDRNPSASVPRGVIVREDAAGNREVYRSDLEAAPTTDAAAAEAVAIAVNPENRIANVIAGTELDRTSSTEAWYCWNTPYYYGGYNYAYTYSYYYANTFYNYQPFYNWYGYGYRYYYYWY
jgi:hypothetical protein